MGIATVALAVATMNTGCNSCQGSSAPPPAAESADAADSAAPAVTVGGTPTVGSPALVAASALAKFFPKDGARGYRRVMSGEKPGFAEAKLEKDGKAVATVSITDAQRLVYTKAKYEGLTEKIGDAPVLKAPNDKETSALVGDRFQVRVVSDTLDHEARKAILASFDLAGLNNSP